MFGVLWDLDGTLVDTEMNHFAAWRELLREDGRDLTHEQFRPTFGLRNDDILVHYFGFSGDRARIDALGRRKEELFRASLERAGLRALPGARELVDYLYACGATQAIASSAPPANIELMLDLSGMRNRFAAVVSAEDVARGKPAPDIILRAAERLGVPPGRCVVLEDAPAGIAAGRAAGCRVIAIASTHPPEELRHADLVVATFEGMLWPPARWEELFG